jgi:hypothetical protein
MKPMGVEDIADHEEDVQAVSRGLDVPIYDNSLRDGY